MTADEANQRDLQVARRRDREEAKAQSRAILVRSVVSIFLVAAIAVPIYYLAFIRPHSADQTYRRIKLAVRPDAPESELLTEDDDIRYFLAIYPKDPRAEEVRSLQAESDLLTLEHRLHIDMLKRVSTTRSRLPIEALYLEAMSYSKTEPDQALVKLRHLIDVFSGPPDASKDELERDAANTTAQYLELARRQEKKLSLQITASAGEQVMLLHRRLATVDTIRDQDPEQARRICRGIVEVFSSRPWAQPSVEKARELLAALPPSTQPAETQPAATQNGETRNDP